MEQAVVDAREINRCRRVPILAGNPCVVHEHVDPSQVTLGLGECVFNSILVGRVERVGDGRRPGFLCAGSCRLGRLFIDVGTDNG